MKRRDDIVRRVKEREGEREGAGERRRGAIEGGGWIKEGAVRMRVRVTGTSAV